MLYFFVMAEASLTRARRDQLIETMAFRLRASPLRAPALVLLAMHAPLAFLGSQFLLAAEPLLGGLGGDRLAHDLAILLQDPQNVELLLSRLENEPLMHSDDALANAIRVRAHHPSPPRT